MMKVILFAAVLMILSGCAQQEATKTETAAGIAGGTSKSVDAADTIKGADDVGWVEKGNMVKVEYVGSFPDGNVFDKSEGRGPLEFEAGAGQMIKGFDEAVIGMKINEEKTVTIAPENAYGTAGSGQKITAPVSQISADGNVEAGMSVYTANGMEGKVTQVESGIATVVFEHPLAGKTLQFWIKVVSIKKNK